MNSFLPLSTFAASMPPEALLALVAKGFLFSVLAVAADAVLRLCSASAGRRHAVWSATLAALLLLPGLSLVLPTWSVPIGLGAKAATPEAPAGTPSPPVAALVATASADEGAATGAAVPNHTEGVVEATPAWTGPAATAATLVWLLVSAALLLRSGVRWWHAGRLLRAMTPWTEGPWARDLEDLRHRLGISRRVRLVASRRALIPGTWGVVRPVVVVPETTRSWRAAQRRAVLLHELCHVRRLDWLTRVVSELTCAVYWFNPLVWYAAWRLDEERERACDEEVVSQGVPPTEYARQLLHVVRHLRLVAPYRPLVALGHQPGLERRIRRILTGGSAAPSSRRSLALTGLATLALLLPLGSVQPWLPEVTAASAQVRSPFEWTGERRVIWSDGRTRFEAVFTGDAEVTAGASGLDRMDPGGVFQVVAKKGREVRRLEITGAPAGAPQYRFLIDGREVPFEPAGRRWLATHLPRIVAETGFGARSHARHLLARGGLERVVGEAAELINWKVKLFYLLEPVRQGLASSDLEFLAEHATRILTGSRELDHFLYAVAPSYLPLTEARAAFLQASHSIASEDDRARLLAACVEDQALAHQEVVIDLIAAGVAVESDVSRAGFLFTISAPVLDRPELHSVFFAALREIRSEEVLARMMGALLTREEPALGSDLERKLFEAALAGIRSDTTKATLLIHLRDRFLEDPALRSAYIDAAATVRNERPRAKLSRALRESGERLPAYPRP